MALHPQPRPSRRAAVVSLAAHRAARAAAPGRLLTDLPTTVARRLDAILAADPELAVAVRLQLPDARRRTARDVAAIRGRRIGAASHAPTRPAA